MKLENILLEYSEKFKGSFDDWKARLPKHTAGISSDRSPDGFGHVSIAFAKRQFQGRDGERYIVGKYFHKQGYGVII